MWGGGYFSYDTLSAFKWRFVAVFSVKTWISANKFVCSYFFYLTFLISWLTSILVWQSLYLEYIFKVNNTAICYFARKIRTKKNFPLFYIYLLYLLYLLWCVNSIYVEYFSSLIIYIYIVETWNTVFSIILF